MDNKFTKFATSLKVDWFMFVPAFLITLAGLFTMNTFSAENYFFFRQSLWILISIIVFFIAATIDWRFLRRSRVLVPIYIATVVVLILLFSIAQVTRGVQSWFQLGALAFQPSDIAKIVVILILSKYFSRRHVEIRDFRHIIVSGFYAFFVVLLVFLQPDFGGAVIIFSIWVGLILASGISKKHLGMVALVAVLVLGFLWTSVFAPYQKDRIKSFLNPMADIHGAGYNAYQSTIAVGSGQILGKGIGQGSQSKLKFLPEYETDFIFAAFAEEWGFIGTLILLSLCLFLLLRIVNDAQHAATNFETLFGLGVAILFSVHIAIHAGMNMGILPVTGITFPLMSYGGSHLLTEWLVLGMLSSMRHHSRGPRIEG